jgi:hypothetical protein
MTPPEEHRLYPIILKQVLWDEDEEKIRKRLAVNDVPAEEAEAIFQAARKERVTTIRAKHRGNFASGLIAFLIGGVIYYGFRIKYGYMHIGVLSGAGIFLVAGFFIMLVAALGYLAASRKKGSVADD